MKRCCHAAVRIWHIWLSVGNDSLVRFILSILLAIIDHLLDRESAAMALAVALSLCAALRVSMSGEKRCADLEFMLCHVSVHEL